MDVIEVCNIWKQQCNVKLRNGEKLCPDCKGKAATFLNASFKQRHFTVRRCPLCIGEGKIDWITAITGQAAKDSNRPTYASLTDRVKDIKMRCTGPLNCKKKLKRLWYKRDVKPFGLNYYQVY